MGAFQSLHQPKPPQNQHHPIAYPCPPQQPNYTNNMDAKAHPSTNVSHAPDPTSPYIQIAPMESPPAKTPMENITDTLNKWGKKAEDMSGNVLAHLRAGPNMADTAWGRITVGTKVLTEGGMANLFKQTFPSSTIDETLLKTYACYVSTSTGPLPGTLYISTHKLAFCSDRPLSNNTTPVSEQQSWNFYKVILPWDIVRAVNPSDIKNKPGEKCIQVITVDRHEFWFMGFVSYDKGLKCMQDALKNRAYKF